MVDLEVLCAYNLDKEGLKKIFSKKRDDLTVKQKALLDRITSRVRAGRDFNISNYQAYYALDLAWDMPFKQISPTLIQSLMDKSPDDKTVADSLKSWGLDLSQMITEVDDPKTSGKKIKKVSVPAFFQVYVPLVSAYLKVRWAKIMNDRRLVPFFKYEPVISNKISRMRCEVITARQEQMSRQYGYFDVMKQATFQMLHYGESVQFPVEEWHREIQEIEASSSKSVKGMKDTEKTVGKGDKKLKVKDVITKEGLRYHLPHPTRTYYDRAYPAATINSDTGCTFAGYWRVLRWRDVVNNGAYYNKEVIGYQGFESWFRGTDQGYWVNVLRGCALNFPSSEAGNSGVSDKDTEKHLSGFYNSDWNDKAIVLTEHFEKLNPKEWDLGDYDHDVWFRFVVAADDTVIYCVPVPYCPPIYYGYDTVGNRTRNVSMSLEIMPFQDQFSNLLSQYLLTVRQNLANISVMDTDMFDAKEIKQVQNWGERWWRHINIFGKSFKEKFQKMGASPNNSVMSYKFPVQDTNQLLNAMKTILDTLERVLVMSAQEVGQAASHEQTREEVRHVQANTSTRVIFTGTAVDVARDTWKRQCYQATMAYGSDEFYAQVPMEEIIDKDVLEKLGFTYSPDKDYDPKDRKAVVQANKSAIAYETFASDRDGEDRINDIQSAQAMTGFLAQLMQNPMTMQAIGPEQAIKLANYIGRFMGFPRDFKLQNIGPDKTPEQQNQEILQQVQQFIQEAMGQMAGEVKKALEPIVQENAKQDEELAGLTQEVQQISQDLSALAQAQNIGSPQPPVPGQFDQPMMEQAPPGSLDMAVG